MYDVAAPTPGVAINGRYDLPCFVSDDPSKRPSVLEPSGLNIKLVEALVEKRVELGLGLAAWFDDERVRSWRLDFMAAEPI